MEIANIMETVVRTCIMHGCQQNLRSLKNGKGKTKKMDNKEIYTENSRERVGRSMWEVLVAGHRRKKGGLSYDLH